MQLHRADFNKVAFLVGVNEERIGIWASPAQWVNDRFIIEPVAPERLARIVYVEFLDASGAFLTRVPRNAIAAEMENRNV